MSIAGSTTFEPIRYGAREQSVIFEIIFLARVPDSQRSARMSEIYCQLDNLSSISDEFDGAFDKFSVDSLQNGSSIRTHTHDSLENNTLENECAETHSIVDTLTMSSLATNFTLGLSDDDSSEMTHDDFILKILNRIIDIALSTVEKQVFSNWCRLDGALSE